MTKSGRVPSAAVPRSRRLIVVAQQAAQAVAATNSGATHRARSRRNQLVAEALVILLLAVVHHELFEYSDTTGAPARADRCSDERRLRGRGCTPRRRRARRPVLAEPY